METIDNSKLFFFQTVRRHALFSISYAVEFSKFSIEICFLFSIRLHQVNVALSA